MKKNIILLASAMLVLSACDKTPAGTSGETSTPTGTSEVITPTKDGAITLKTNKDGEEVTILEEQVQAYVDAMYAADEEADPTEDEKYELRQVSKTDYPETYLGKGVDAKTYRDTGNKDKDNFEKFDLTLYDAAARGTMKQVFTAAKYFAENFPEGSQNLLFQGGTGLGKTFLSACVARAVADRGYSVCYDTAAAVVGSFEAQKFAHDEEADARVRRMLSCDLLILDDLGTEMPTPMAASALYTLINTRLAEGKKTIISTNLSFDEMERRYSAQICSRIRGAYERLPFVGRDIRLIRK